MSNSISKYLTHTVDVKRVSMSRGSRSTTLVEDVAAFIAERIVVVRTSSGDQESQQTVVFMEPDQAIDENDEVKVDSEFRPVERVVKARDRSGIHHLEVVLK